MSKNKKRNTQVPQEAIKGPADKSANFSICCMSNQQIKEELLGQLEKYKTEITNQHVRESIKSTDLEAGSVIKAYDNKDKETKKDSGHSIGE